ncbi:undecaprenyl-diphosphate phosphatase [Patescibacteria group bacterium]
MSILQSIILGAIQGVTEWLPISSSGHLVIAQEFFGLQNYLFFDILLHTTTLFVVFIVFWKDIIEILKSIIKLDFKSEYGELAVFIITGSIPTAIIGFLFQNIFEKLFTNLFAVAISLMVTGILLLSTKIKKHQKSANLNKKKATLIGIAQGVAIIPGISRSGATISAGILSGIDRMKVARFSFLLSIPAILGALLFKINKNIIAYTKWQPIIFGMITALIVGYIFLKLLLSIIKSDKFHIFGYYCITLSIILINILIFVK